MAKTIDFIQGEKLEKHYSGENSRYFWDKINKIEGKKGKKLYVKGCRLQNLEEEVLKELEKKFSVDWFKVRKILSGTSTI